MSGHVRLHLIAGTALILAACATAPHLPDVETPGMANPEAALQRSVARVDAAMAQLGRMSAASRPYASGGAVVPPELQKQVSLTWSGPIDEAAKALADQVGYRFVSTGPTVPPVPVSIAAQDQPIVEMFRTLGSQAGVRATLTVDAESHQVEVRHNG